MGWMESRPKSRMVSSAFLVSSAIAASIASLVGMAHGATVITCSTDLIATQMAAAAASDLGDYACGSPDPGLLQAGPEDVYEFSCQESGDVSFFLSDLVCDLDIYVLDSSCDSNAGCLEGSTDTSSVFESLTFPCVAGKTYAVVIEGAGFDSGACTLSQIEYTLDIDVGQGTGCAEDCDNGLDDDADGDTDCADSHCSLDPVCAAPTPVQGICVESTPVPAFRDLRTSILTLGLLLVAVAFMARKQLFERSRVSTKSAGGRT